MTDSVIPSRERLTEEHLRKLMASNPPREVPANLKRLGRDPVLLYLAWFMPVMLAFVLISTVGLSAMPNTRSTMPSWMMWTITGVVLVPMLVAAIWAWRGLWINQRLLSDGLLTQGSIETIKQIPANINGTRFYSVKVKGFMPGQPNLMARATINDQYLELFLDKRDQRASVEIIYNPGRPGRVLLLQGLVMESRLD